VTRRKRMQRRRAGPTALAGAYVGSVIGAGFASGREHAAFFLRFGADGLLGLAAAGLMFTLFGAGLLRLACRRRTQSHLELLRALAAPRVAALFDALLTAALFVSLAVMIAGAGALVHARWGAPELAGRLGMALLTLAVALLRVDAMLRAHAALAAVLAALIAAMGISALPRALESGWPPAPVEHDWVPGHWAASAVLYGAYNLALTLTLFGALGSEIQDEREAAAGGAAGGAVLFLLGLCVCLAVAASLPGAGEPAVREIGEIPALPAARRLGPWAEGAYSAAVGLAMLTTAVSSAYALAKRLAGASGQYRAWALAAVGAALPLAGLGFGRLVGTLYPVIGYVGMGCLGLAALQWAGASRRKGRR